MKDLSILKSTPDPVALPDSDYPDWLWTLTDQSLASSQLGKKAGELDAEGGMGVVDPRAGMGEEKGFDQKAERRKLRSRSVIGRLGGVVRSSPLADYGICLLPLGLLSYSIITLWPNLIATRRKSKLGIS